MRRMQPAHPDVIVVGLGAVGSAACHHLARAGASVVGIDRFHPPHSQGSSHGLTRITRLAVGEGEAYVPLALRSHQLWRALESSTGETLYTATGGLLIASDAADALPYHGGDGFFARTVQLARSFGIGHELLDADAVRRRFPAFQPGDQERAYLEHDAGVLFPEKAVAAQLAEARRCGARLRLGEQVLGFARRGADVEVSTSAGRLTAARVLVAAGPWVAGLAGLAGQAGSGLRSGSPAMPLRVQRQVLYWFRTSAPRLYAPAACPVFIWLHGAGAAGSMYGFPMIDGVDGVKVATEQYEVDTDPDHVDRVVHGHEVAAMHATHVAGRLRGVQAEAVRTATCLYTNAPKAAFQIGPHALGDAITVVSACSGHGFKHSAALGEALAQQMLGQTPVLLSPFLAA